MTFVMNCARLSVTVGYYKRPMMVTIPFIDVEIRRPNWAPTHDFDKLCYIEPSGLNFCSWHRYACHRTIRYPCVRVEIDDRGREHTETVAWLVVDNMEIEIDASADSHRGGHFAKEPEYCT